MIHLFRYVYRHPHKTMYLLMIGVLPGSEFGSGTRLKGLWNRINLLSRAARQARGRLVCSSALGTGGGGSEEPISIRFSPVPKLTADLKITAVSRLICFFLPQFHPIPENDRWWGAGFTEWTNVKPARPQFLNHYQPHVPTELGYYNLLDPGVQKRQVELAKLYGIGGFCFYFYWFGGKRLLEEPITNYLRNQSLDLPFCLCWANENWTRRWDGLDSEVLMKQEHSAEDDIAFIAHISQYFRDPRYIRVDGRPLLVVYRPSLLPSPRETADRWRKWCRSQGLGEIHLAYTQSFERIDPAGYGFDSAIEFPPNNSAPPQACPDGVSEEFKGSIFDWSVFVERSRQYEVPAYRLFRGVNPSWDNTARKKNRSTIFVNSNPVGYQQWLVNAILDSHGRLRSPDEQLTFINAWNEWAEGAHLEPDARYGFAFLEATRVARVRAEVMRSVESRALRRKLAVLIHVFYLDVFREMVDSLRDSLSYFGGPVFLYVSTTELLRDEVKAVCDSLGVEFSIFVYPNRGRDVLPFLQMLHSINLENFDLVLKLHTKKSLHRSDGDIWRRDICAKLLDREVVAEIHRAFEQNPTIGFVGPEGYVVAMNHYFGSNAKTVFELAGRLGADASEVMSLRFIAGTMFYARVSALLPLLSIELGIDCFEHEEGQIDGTLAHGIERAFAISAKSVGLTIASTDELGFRVGAVVGRQKSLKQFYRPQREG